MNKESILNNLRADCPFPKLFEEREQLPVCGDSYRRKIVHIRADYDGNQWWPHHTELATPAIRKEVDSVYAALISPGAFSNLPALTEFCTCHPEALVNRDCRDEFNFYLDGELCCYWLRCICRAKDYNLYLHAFLKAEGTD